MRKVLAAGVLVVAGLVASVGVGWTSDNRPSQLPTSTGVTHTDSVCRINPASCTHGPDPLCGLYPAHSSCVTDTERIGRLEKRVAKLERQVKRLSQQR